MYAKLITSEANKRRAQLAGEADPKNAGLVRGNTRSYIASCAESDPILVMNFGREAIVLNNKGEELVSRLTTDEGVVEDIQAKASDFTRGWHLDLEAVGVVPGSIPTNKMIDDIRIPAGVVLIVGGASTAKTPMAHLLAGSGVDHYAAVRYGEPFAGYMSDPRLAAIALGDAVMHESDIVFDSIKDLLAFAPGGSMSSGVSRGALPIMSDLSIIASTVGATLYVPLNPSTPDQKTVDAVIEAAKSNVAMVLTVESTDETKKVLNWFGLIRQGEGLLREEVRFSTTFDDDGDLRFVTKDSSRSKAGKVNAQVTTSMIGDDALDALLRKHIR